MPLSPRENTRRTASSNVKSKTYLYLESNLARFNAPSKRESVFFDECNREIISLTSGFEQTNKTRVVFQRTDSTDKVEFQLPIEKRILSIKLNSLRTILAYHVERNTVEFINIVEKAETDGAVKYVLDSKRYVQSSRAKNSKLIGFLWTGPHELVIITDLSVEYYHLDSARNRLNHIKMFQSATNWFVYQPQPAKNLVIPSNADTSYSILMVSTGSLGNSMQPYMFNRGRILKFQRFEVEGSWEDSEKLELFERSITIAYIYGYVRLLVLQHESLNVKSKGAQIVLYTVDPVLGTTSKTHTLDLDVSGRFAINVLDNLVVAHDQPTKSSFIFDINIKSTEKSDCPDHFVSLLDRRPIMQLKLSDGKPVDMYSLNWVFFQPNFIVDAKLGLLTTLKLDLDAITEIFQDNNLVLGFLSNRANSTKTILKKCRQIVMTSYRQATRDKNQFCNPLAEISSTFEHLGRLAISAPELTPDAPSVDEAAEPQFAENLIYQEDIHREVLRDIGDDHLEEPASYHFAYSTLLEFIFVVRRYGKNVEFCIYEQLLKTMMKAKKHFQVVQMIRSDVLKGSKQLACSLLSIKDQYYPAAQLGLDMLQKLTGGGVPSNLN